MLKKAGILVAATAAGLLAVSPLAFAGDKGGHGGYDGDSDGDRQVNRFENERENNQNGLVNVDVIDDVNVLNDACAQIPVAAGIGNVLGIIGSGSAANDDTSCSTNSGDTGVNVDD